MGLAGQHQQGLPLGGEHQTVGDRPDFATQGGGSRGSRRNGLEKRSELDVNAGSTKCGLDLRGS